MTTIVNYFKVSYRTWLLPSLLMLFFLSLSFGRHHIFGYYPINGNYSDFTAISLYYSDILAILLCIYGLFHVKLSNNWHKSSIILLLGWFVIAIIPRETYGLYTISLSRLIEVFLLFIFFLNPKTHKPAFISIALAGLVQILIEIPQYIFQHSLGLKILGEPTFNRFVAGVAKIDFAGSKIVRPYGTFSHPNQLAAFLIVSCATSIFLYLTSTGKIKKFWGAIIFFSTAGEMLTFSRVGFVTLIIMFCIIFYLVKIKSAGEATQKNLRQLSVIIIGSFIITGMAVLPILTTRATFNDNAYSDRVFYDQNGLQIIKENPLFGGGLGSLIYKVAQNLPTNAASWQVQPPHNYFLDVADETGLIGVGMLILFYILLLKDFFKALREKGDDEKIFFNITLFSILVAILIMMQFDHYFYTLQQTQLLLWICLGIIAGAIYNKNLA